MWRACLKRVCDVQDVLRYFTVGVMSARAFSYLGRMSREKVMEGCEVFKEPQKLNDDERQSLCRLAPAFHLCCCLRRLCACSSPEAIFKADSSSTGVTWETNNTLRTSR